MHIYIFLLLVFHTDLYASANTEEEQQDKTQLQHPIATEDTSNDAALARALAAGADPFGENPLDTAIVPIPFPQMDILDAFVSPLMVGDRADDSCVYHVFHGGLPIQETFLYAGARAIGETRLPVSNVLLINPYTCDFKAGLTPYILSGVFPSGEMFQFVVQGKPNDGQPLLFRPHYLLHTHDAEVGVSIAYTAYEDGGMREGLSVGSVHTHARASEGSVASPNNHGTGIDPTEPVSFLRTTLTAENHFTGRQQTHITMHVLMNDLSGFYRLLRDDNFPQWNMDVVIAALSRETLIQGATPARIRTFFDQLIIDLKTMQNAA